jgi:hypothetical protein
MKQFTVSIDANDAVTGEPIDPSLLAKHGPMLKTHAERFGEFMLAIGQDDDLAVIARATALIEYHLRRAITEKIEHPEHLEASGGASVLRCA